MGQRLPWVPHFACISLSYGWFCIIQERYVLTKQEVAMELYTYSHLIIVIICNHFQAILINELSQAASHLQPIPFRTKQGEVAHCGKYFPFLISYFCYPPKLSAALQKILTTENCSDGSYGNDNNIIKIKEL